MQRALSFGLFGLLIGCNLPKEETEYGEPELVDSADPACVSETGDADGPGLTILHTNDWQSHMLGWGPNTEYSPDTTGDDTTVGGLARIKTLVDEIRCSATHPVVLYDGGDWMAGALFQLLRDSHASELQMMQMIGYDAVCLGNHEFDWGPDGLADIILKGDELGVTVPILATNTEPNRDDPGDDKLEALFDSGRIQDVRVDTLPNGLKIGLFGLVGSDAASVSPMVAPAQFTDAVEAAAGAVETLESMGVDIVVALSHSGVTDDPATSEDEQLAILVPGIDVIVSGHSHTPLPEPKMIGSTVIVQAGAYTEYLGQLELKQRGSGWQVANYTLHQLTDDTAGDPDANDKVDGFVQALEDGPLSSLGYGFDEPLFQIDGDVAVEPCAESGLGDFITDAYRYHLTSLDPDDPIVVAFESQGVIRDDLLKGMTGVESFSDAFRVMPLGLGNDGVPGYGLVTFYATAMDLRNACEVTGSIAPSYGCSYFVEVSGLRCTMDWDRGLGGTTRAVDLWKDGAWEPLDTSDTTTLYRIAVDSYVAGLMNLISEYTYNAIIIEPKDADGNVVADTDTRLFDKDPSTPGIQEVKLWEAIIAYAQTFEDTDGDGLANVPASYTEAAGRYVTVSE